MGRLALPFCSVQTPTCSLLTARPGCGEMLQASGATQSPRESPYLRRQVCPSRRPHTRQHRQTSSTSSLAEQWRATGHRVRSQMSHCDVPTSRTWHASNIEITTRQCTALGTKVIPGGLRLSRIRREAHVSRRATSSRGRHHHHHHRHHNTHSATGSLPSSPTTATGRPLRRVDRPSSAATH